ncbi:hypothetical protein ABB37_02202 [Leptomonas pyrrhocoris]|uniref:Checkpoint protein n=1 Tax=Leptomonas pyrrhocoris TaxID=157538 RepID=A0A0M9G7F9_LEPPY|nr:hypothetical protein ABB37_02202 [Leptomonas pyrrhocoris]KPA84107.1 hypothetical protein ABB37_02202 [Leptomonas pyrrhocoris]|eukprot:XP_015662546.1 hypothetical protein ABB37_02202 [Leptomonas pyrrhocoris]
MRFKAVLNDAKGLLGALQVCHSIQRDCIIRLHPERTRIFSNMTVAVGVQVWLGCKSSSLFTNMVCNSSDTEQSITCEVLDLAQLIHIVKLAEVRERAHLSASQVLIRLTKTGQRPLLKVSMDGLAGQPDLCFDVPLRILSDRDIQGMVPPPLEKRRLKIMVPDILELTTFIDKLKNTAADNVTFSARVLTPAVPRRSAEEEAEDDEEAEEDYPNDASAMARRKRKRKRGSGVLPYASLVVNAEHFMARISLKYEAVPLMETPEAQNGAEEEVDDARRDAPMAAAADRDNRLTTVTVETKKFARFFSTVKAISPDEICMYLVNKRALVLSVFAAGNNTTLVAYIPAKTAT